MTSKHLQQSLFSMTQSAEAFHVNQSVQQAKEKALQKLQNLVCGLNSSEPYAWYDQNTLSWRTYQLSLVTEWTSFSETFTRQGIMNVNGVVYQAQVLELAISETDGFYLESLPTPTTMDTKEDGLKHATKLLQGKTHRSSGQPIQITLSDKVMMDQIKQNPKLMKIYQDHQMEERPNLPTQEEFVSYLRSQTTIKKIAAKTNIKKTTIEHWFRKDKAGFSYPSIENWKEIKPHLATIKYDQEMTTVTTKEWITKNQMLPTPRAAIGMNMKLSEGMARLEHKKYLETEIAAKIHIHGDLPNIDSTQIGESMYLNPCFCEEMMGYEIGWTDLEP